MGLLGAAGVVAAAVLQLLGHLNNLPRQELVARLREMHVVPVSDLL